MRIKLRIISKAEDANYELTFTLKLKAEEKAFERTKIKKELKKKNRKSVSGLYCQQGRCLHNASHCDSIVITAMPLWIRRILLL
jgi:hypothetical protein